MDDVAWITAEVECVICQHAWVAVYPAPAPALECPECGYMNGIPEVVDDD